MFLRFSRTALTVAAVLTFLALHPATNAQTLECDILQYKMNRLYFGAGKEALVYPGCRYAVVCGTDTLLGDLIDQSYPGVSLSRPLLESAMPSDLENCQASITPAAIDTSTAIVLGCRDGKLEGHLVPLRNRASDRPLPPGFTNANRAVTLKEVNEYALTTGSGLEGLDGFISFAGFPDQISHSMTLHQSDAPFIAVLIPNLHRECNRDGFLTTSLYYRFDIATVFGDNPDGLTPTHRLYFDSANSPRSYPYDPEKGRMLLKKLKDRPKKITIAVGNRSLLKVAEFFADVLSRDRIRVEIVDEATEADLRLVFVPLSIKNPLVSPVNVYWKVKIGYPRFTPRIKESVAVLSGYIENAEGDSTTYDHFARLADDILQNDLGVFPLYRPTVHLATADHLIKVTFTESGYPDFDNMIKLILPDPEAEE